MPEFTANRAQYAAILVGGFIGPYTGQALTVVLPEFAETFDIPLSLAASTVTFYLVPFAVAMIFSGRLVREFRPRRVITAAYATIAPLAAWLFFAPSWWSFAVAFAALGVANAFTTPVLQMILRSISPPDQLGRALGTYAAMQSLGMLSSPFVAGMVAEVTWRLSFVVTVAVALFILAVRVPDVPAPVASDTGVGEPIPVARTIVSTLTSFVAGFGVVGVGFLTALYVGDTFGLGPDGRGLVVMCGGLAAFAVTRLIGSMADRHGPSTVLVASALVAAAALALLPLAPAVLLVAACWAVAIAAAQGMQATVNLVVLRGPAGSSLLSTVQAFRFGGAGVSPLVFLPLYTGVGGRAFWLSTAALLLVGLAQWAIRPKAGASKS